MAEVIRRFAEGGAATTTATPDGVELQGTVVRQGVFVERESIRLSPDWYSGYLRVATNEKHVVRSYFSAGDPNRLHDVEMETRRVLERQFDGRVID
jgi:hypothetical protein